MLIFCLSDQKLIQCFFCLIFKARCLARLDLIDLTHLCHVNSSDLAYHGSPFRILAVSGLWYRTSIIFTEIIPVFKTNAVDTDPKPTARILIWFYTICQGSYRRQ